MKRGEAQETKRGLSLGQGRGLIVSLLGECHQRQQSVYRLSRHLPSWQLTKTQDNQSPQIPCLMVFSDPKNWPIPAC